MRHKVKKRSIPKMGVVGGLTEAARNISDNETFKRTGIRPKKKGPYEGGIGQAIENAFTGLGNFFSNRQSFNPRII